MTFLLSQRKELDKGSSGMVEEGDNISVSKECKYNIVCSVLKFAKLFHFLSQWSYSFEKNEKSTLSIYQEHDLTHSEVGLRFLGLGLADQKN